MTNLLTQHGYKWPSIYTPMAHQQVTAEFMTLRPRSFCLNDIGTAKTLSILWAIDFLMHAGKVRKVLIVSPLSTLWTVWGHEIFMNIPHRKHAILHGSKAKRLKELKKDVDFYIINHHGTEVIEDALRAHPYIDLVVVDEGAEFSNSQTYKWECLWNQGGPHTGRALWWMTGSPMPKGPTDIWAQAKMINPGLVPTYFSRFRDDLMYKQGNFRWVPRPGWEDKCYSMMQPSIRYKRDECIDLPPLTTQLRKTEMSTEQGRAYSQMFNTFVAELAAGKITAVNEGVKRIKLMQIAAGAVYDGNQVTHWLDCKPKLDALRGAILESGNKAIVFVSFRHSIPLLEHFLRTKLGLTVGIVVGGVGTGVRNNIFNSFQHGDLQIILAHPGCMAHGLNLTASHTIIWWAPVDSFRIYEQACGRISRSGQTMKQTVVQMSCSEVENKIYSRLLRKEKMQGLLLKLLREGRAR